MIISLGWNVKIITFFGNFIWIFITLILLTLNYFYISILDPQVPPVFQNVGKVITSGYYQHPHNHGINGILHILQHPQTAIENPVI